MKFLKFLLLFLSIIIPFILSFYLYQNFLTTCSCLDAFSHLYIAKNIIHNGKNSTIKNLGSVWLPFYHLLLIPFIFFDNLYYSGFGGTLLNIFLFFFVIYLFFKLLPYPHSIFASLISLFSPYLLIYAISPMTEILTIFLLTLSFYYFIKEDLNRLIIVVILGTLTRYEFYPIATFLFFYYFKKSKKAFLFFFGIIFWLVWNYLLFSDPFFFYHHPVTKDACGNLPYAFHWKNLINFNLKILKEIFGYLPIISFFSFCYLLYKKKFKTILLIFTFFTHLFLEYFNISLGYARFYLLSFPFFLIIPFLTLNFVKKKIIKVAFLFLIFLSYLPNFESFTIFQIGKNHYFKKFPYGHHLDINYPLVKEKIIYFQNLFCDLEIKNKKLLIPSFQEFQVFSFALKIRPEYLFDAYDEKYPEIIRKPEKYCEIFVIENELNQFSYRFHKFFKNNYYSVLFYQDQNYQKKILNNFVLFKKDDKYSIYLKKI